MVKLPIVDQVISLVRKPVPPMVHAAPAAVPAARDARIRAAFEAAPVGIVVTTVDGAWVLYNERFRHLAGYSREQLARMAFHDLTHPDDAKHESAMLRRLIAGELPSYRLEKRLMEKKGKYRDVVATCAIARGAQGGADCLVHVVEERVRVDVVAAPSLQSDQDKALRLAAHVGELKKTIESMRAELLRREQNEASLRAEADELRAAAGKTHDELTILTGALRKEIARRKKVEAELREALERAEAAAAAIAVVEPEPPAAPMPPPEPLLLDDVAGIVDAAVTDLVLDDIADAADEIAEQLEMIASHAEIVVASPSGRTRKFHRASCPTAKRFVDDTRVVFTSPDDAARAGYEACRNCFR